MKKLILSLLLTCATIASSFSQLADNSFAPNFTVSAYQSWLSSAGQTSNGSYSLYSYLDAGYTVILDVSATWCGPCWNFHLTGALEDLYAAHGPAGFPGVNQGTTDDVMVFWIDASPSSDDASMMDGNGSIGNWIEPTTGNKIQYPMTNLASPAAFSNDYAIAGYPTVYKICPNRLVSEIGPGNAAALYSSIASCPPAASLPNDVGAISYNGELAHCQGAYTPKVTIQNNGLSNLTTASITVKQNGTTISTGTFSGSLTTYATSLVTCTPIANFNGGTLTVSVTTTNDGLTSNNNLAPITISPATNAISQYVIVNITTDRDASESTWQIKNSTGTVVSSGGPWTNLTAIGTTVQTPVQVALNPSQCYTFIMNDSYGDGMCCQYGNGGYSVTGANGAVLASGGDFDDSETSSFKTGVLGVDELNSIALNVYPNPATDLVNISFEGENTDYSIALMDLQGRVISSREMANVSGEQLVSFSTENVAKGSYIVTVSTNGTTTTKNVVIK
jgi:hypothetical protein